MPNEILRFARIIVFKISIRKLEKILRNYIYCTCHRYDSDVSTNQYLKCPYNTDNIDIGDILLYY